MEKLDLTKHYKAYYKAKIQPEIVDIEQAGYISIGGKGDPSQKEFSDHIQALYQTAYTLKFMFKAMGKDFVVSKLEGLWSFDEEQYKGVTMESAPVAIPRSEWNYTLLIRMPDFVENEQVLKAIDQILEKKQNPLVKQIIYLQRKAEKAAQILHQGPFDLEPESLLKLKSFMDSNGLTKQGLHHEIYLTDFRKTAPEKLKTILREPVTSS